MKAMTGKEALAHLEQIDGWLNKNWCADEPPGSVLYDVMVAINRVELRERDAIKRRDELLAKTADLEAKLRSAEYNAALWETTCDAHCTVIGDLEQAATNAKAKIEELLTRNAELQADLATNAALLARQTDLAREAELGNGHGF